MGREIKSLEDILNEKAAGPIPVKKEQKKSKKNKKGIIIATIALLMAAVTAISCYVFKKKKSVDTEIVPTTTVETQVGFDDIGKELEQPENSNSQYGNATGNVDPNKIVEQDGVIYVDQDSANKAGQVGQTNIDTQNGKLEVKDDGVYEKEPGYEVKDENGNTIETGSNESGIPAGYIKLDKNYYYKDGSLAFKKGDIVDESEFNSLKHLLITDPKQAIQEPTTQQPTTQEPTTQEPTTQEPTTQEPTTQEPTTQEPITETKETFIPATGTSNGNGTYTVNGLTFASKADYDQWIIQGYEGYGVDSQDGIMKPAEDILSNSKTK